MKLQQKGIHIQVKPAVLTKLATLCSKYKPDSLVILGDVKYTVVGNKQGEWQDIMTLSKTW